MKPRPRWWRLINWRIVALAAVPAWLLAGVAVAKHLPRADVPVPELPPTAKPPETARPTPAPPTGNGPTASLLGPLLWSGLTASLLDPRSKPFADVPPLPVGPFACILTDPANESAGEAKVFRRARGGPPLPNGPPEVIEGRPTFGTFIGWRKNPADAMTHAGANGKLALILQVAGNLEDPWFAGTNATALRTNVFQNEAVCVFLNARFDLAIQRVTALRRPRGHPPGGGVVAFLVTPDGTVIHALPGAASGTEFFREAKWAADTFDRHGDDPAKHRQSHFDALKQDYRTTLPFDAMPAVLPKLAPTGRPLTMAGVGDLAPRGQVHALLAAYPLPRWEQLFLVVWESVLTERAGLPNLRGG